MMEPSNLNIDLYHQEDFHGSSSMSLPWSTQDVILNNGEMIMRATTDMPVLQDLGLQWHQSAVHGGGQQEETIFDLQDYYTLLMCSHAKHEPSHIPGPHQHSNTLEPVNYGRTTAVAPSVNISSSCLQPLYASNPLAVDLQPLDLLATTRFSRTMSQPSLNTMALMREGLDYRIPGQMQEPSQALDTTSFQASYDSVRSGVTNSKRSSSSDCPQPAAKKPRFESQPSFTPFKVRKEKLGDRIAALQQLVAPFGKTDTASVLMEAIGYIKFLQDQVETLTVPYMRSSNNTKSGTLQTASSKERDETKSNLRSRGLCLVPLSCTSYITNDHGGVWSNYRDGT